MKQKRVRFAGINEDDFWEVPSAPPEKNAEERPVDPKTSEYTFFKKLKETAGLRSNAHLQDKSHSKKLRSDDCFKEKSTAVKNRHKDLSSASLTLNVTPDNSFSFVPRDCISKNLEVDIHREMTVLGVIQNLQAESYGNPSRHGDQHKHALIFSEKRQKLRRWVAETSLPEIDELCSKGYDFVSLLLSRLLPESDKDKSLNCFKSSESHTEIDFKFNPAKKLYRIPAKNFVDTEFLPPKCSGSPTYLLEFPCDSELLNELDEVRYPDDCSIGIKPQKCLLCQDFDRMADEKKSSVAPEISFCSHDNYFDNRIHEVGCKVGERATPVFCADSDSSLGFLAERHKSFVPTCLNEREEVRYPDEYPLGREPQEFLLGWDFGRAADEKKSPVTPEISSCSHDIYFYNRHKLGCKVGERATPILCADSDSSFGFCSERYKSFASTCLNELDKVLYPDECSHRREPQKYLLGWDFERMTDEKKRSITPENTDVAIYPISCREEQQFNLDNRFHMHDLCEPNLLSHRDCDLTSSWCSPSGGSYNSSGHFLEVKDDAFDALNGFSLPASNTENHLNPFVYSNSETTTIGRNFLLSPSNHLWFLRKVLTEEHHFPATKPLFPLELDFNQGRTCLAANASSRDNYSTTYHALEFPPSEGIYSHIREEYGNFHNNPSEGRIISHLRQGMFNIHDWSSYYLQASIDKEKAYPLLLDNSDWNKPESETYSDSDEKQLF